MICMDKLTVIVPAAGAGKRLGLGKNKVFAMLGGLPLLVQCLRMINDTGMADKTIIAAGAAEIDDIKEKLKFKYGEITKTDVKYYSFNKKPFEEYTIWWSSDLASVSLYVKPDLDSLDRVIKLYSYRISFYDEIRLKEIYSLN